MTAVPDGGNMRQELNSAGANGVVTTIGRVRPMNLGPAGSGARRAATLAAELWAADRGVDWIRTHDVRALRDALRVRDALRAES